MPLLEYINENFSGSQVEFAKYLDVKPQQITQWIGKGFIVVNGILYSPRRDILRK